MFRKCSLLLLSVIGIHASEFVVIPHIAADTQSFQTLIVLENGSDRAVNVSLLSLGNGSSESTVMSLPAQSRQTVSIGALFPEKAVSHLFVDRIEGLKVGVTYIPRDNPANRTFVEGISTFTQRWRVYPSNWEKTYDGLAIVNPGCSQVSLTVTQYSAQGEYITNIPVEAGNLLSHAKLIFNLGSKFDMVEDSYIEISADAPIAAMGLKGTNPGSGLDFLVGNMAIPAPPFEDLLQQVNAAEELWANQSLSQHHSYQLSTSCFCPQKPTVDMAFNDAGMSRLAYHESGVDVPLAEIGDFRSIPGLFDLIRETVYQGADSIKVQFDPQYGYPKTIEIDYLSCYLDDELILQVNEMHETE